MKAGFFIGGVYEERDMTAEEIAALPGRTLTAEQAQAALLQAVDARLNSVAKDLGYDSIHTASLRAALPDSPYHAQGVALGTWMDQTYQKCYAVLAQVQAGERSIPTEADLMAELPPPPEF